MKAFARRSVANEELKKWHDAFEDLKKAVELDPNLRSKARREVFLRRSKPRPSRMVYMRRYRASVSMAWLKCAVLCWCLEELHCQGPT